MEPVKPLTLRNRQQKEQCWLHKVFTTNKSRGRKKHRKTETPTKNVTTLNIKSLKQIKFPHTFEHASIEKATNVNVSSWQQKHAQNLNDLNFFVRRSGLFHFIFGFLC